MTTAADLFTIGVGPWTDTQPLQEIGQFDEVSISSSLDSGTEVAFNVPGRSPTARAIDELATDIWVYRQSTPFARCRIVDVQQSWGPSGEDEVTVTAVDYKRLLNRRHVQSLLTYTGVDQAQIIWNLIQHTQAQPGGDLGIIAGVLPSGTPRDRTYTPGDNIGKVLSDLSAVIGGPWWGVDAFLVLQVTPYPDFPVQVTPVLLGVTASAMSRKSGAATFANSAFVDGDNAETIPVIYDHPDIALDPRGRWERAEGFPTVTLQDTLQEKAEGVVEESMSPIAQWTCEIDPARFLTDADYFPGDFVELIVPPTTVAPIGTPVFSTQGQVVSTELTISADGETSATIEVVEIPA